MNPIIRRFRVCIVDDYRAGPGLHCSEIKTDSSAVEDENSDDRSYDDDWDEIEFEVPDARCHVFHFKFDQEPKLLQSFETWTEDKLYAQQQYTLVTGDPPFISNGEYNCAYHPEGSRLPIAVEGMTTTIEPDIYDDNGYLFIIHGPKYQTYSLNPYAVW